MIKKYVVSLSKEERFQLQAMISTGRSAARKLSHARILLLADTAEGGRTDQKIVAAVANWTRRSPLIRSPRTPSTSSNFD